MDKWTELLNGFKQYALANDGVIDAAEQAQIAKIQGDIDAIKARIAQIEEKKGLGAPPTAQKLTASVGQGAVNAQEDVRLVQQLLNKKSNAGLSEDGAIGAKTIAAIKAFQQKAFGWSDGRIDPDGKSWQALSGSNAQTPAPTPVEEVVENKKEEPVEEINNTLTTETNEDAAASDLYTLSDSVGKGGKNNKTDVILVQSLLNRHGAGIGTDGDCGNKTITAIENFQQAKLGSKTGLIESASPTFKALLAKPDKVVAGQEEIISGLGASGKLGNSIIKKGDYVISIPPNALGSYPLMMLFSGLNQNAYTLQGQVPDVYYLKAIVVFSGPNGKFSAAQSLYQPILTEKGLGVASISICGYSLGGQAAFREYGHATKAVGLIDPTTYYGDLAKIDAKAIFSAYGNSTAWSWSGKKPGNDDYKCMHARQDGIKTALAKGGVGEDTKVGHGVYPQYFLSKFRSKLI